MLPGSGAWSQPQGSELNLSFLLASDYKHNGLSATASGPVARFAADYEHQSGFFAGGFLANVEYYAERYYKTPRDYQVNVYAGYIRRGTTWTTSVSASRYVYPGISFRYDYTQLAVNASFRDRLFFGAGHSDNFLSIDRTAYHYHAGVALPAKWDLEIGINAGRFRSSELFGTEYSFWDIGVSRALRRFAFDLRYHDNTYDRSTILGDGGGDRWVLSVAYALAPSGRSARAR